MRRYNPKEIEPKWQRIWADSGIYKTDMGRTADKFYVIPMLPYPSGDLHIGHWYNFAPTDTVARFHRMLGQNVFQTVGFDAFGLPAENAAIKRGIQPAIWTYGNIATMTKQLEQIGASYDWSHSLITAKPDYYHWNQWLFLKLFEKELAYRAKRVVNWCPKDQTVLANEQVVGEDNVCERCGTPVIQKELEQWFFKITDYADRLLADLENVDWPDKVKTMQENWIGKSQGALINFAVDGHDKKIEVFTTRPDTIYGATYMVLAPEHPLVPSITSDECRERVESYIEETKRKTELERKEGEKHKTGSFTGAYAINPATKEKIPIWIADYVLSSYGTGAIMAVPAHDERDFEFAKKFNLAIKYVIADRANQMSEYDTSVDFEDDSDEAVLKRLGITEQPFVREGYLIQSGKYNGMSSAEAREKIAEKFGKLQTNYRLRDWLISRQRYWGTPIPIIYCDDCGMQAVPEKDLPVILPEDVEFTPTGRNPLLDRPDFVDAKCPKCGKPARRETDTMDTFVDSSWYYLRYLDNTNNKAAFGVDLINKWMPVDHYIGGIEHAILHLLYARFVTKFLHDHHNLSFEEPFRKLTNQGIILGPDGQKMSKSRGNVVAPDEQVTSYGTDSLRLYLMFMGSYEQGGPYSLSGIAGTRRFLDRAWTLIGEFLEAPAEPKSDMDEAALVAATHRTIKKVTEDLERLGFNTAISAMMSLVNDLYKVKTQEGISQTPAWRQSLETLVQLLAPFAPHIAEEMWQDLGHKESVHISNWPLWDEALAKEEMVTLAVQINGKVRSEIIVAADITEKEAIAAAKADDKIAEHLKGHQIKKEIYVPGRLVSLVI
ncbi:MAG TPA: leucine--tRNA ligase [Candidatus Saccharimonadales bacterium]|nr:leucine--tRNA ligase [Candidatus Saccharimonadales bacterium]